MSSKPGVGTGVGSESKLGVTAEKIDTKPVKEAEAPQPFEHEVRERRNGYQMISTAAYYQIERRGFSGFGEAYNRVEAKTGLNAVPGIDEAPYSEDDLTR